MSVKQLRVPVQVDRDVYDLMKAYSEITGVPVARVIREGLTDFAESVLSVRLEALQGTKQSVVLEGVIPPDPLADTDNVISFAKGASAGTIN